MTKEFFEKIIFFVTSAFGLIAALAWNNAINALIDRYIPKGSSSSLIYLFIYAIFITFVAVSITIQSGKISKKLEEKAAKQGERIENGKS